jgi:hypothetical protein
MVKDRDVLEQAGAARPIEVNLTQSGTRTQTSVTFAGDDGKIEHYEFESITYGGSKQAHRVAHALRDLAFHIDLHNREE